eukprot:6632989-Alexandrium_andersonii.AAC.1
MPRARHKRATKRSSARGMVITQTAYVQLHHREWRAEVAGCTGGAVVGGRCQACAAETAGNI